MRSIFENNNRQQSIQYLKEAYKNGYRFVVREEESEYLLCFSLKPKKYRKMEFWGYVDENAEGALPANLIKNTDIEEINWKNRSATLIEDLLKEQTHD